MQDFPSNSAKARGRSEDPTSGDRETIQRVTSVEAKRRRKGIGRQFKETFFEGTGRMAMTHAVDDIVVPTVRDLLFDIVQGGFERWVYGESRGRRRYTPPSMSYPDRQPHIPYNRMSTATTTRTQPTRMLSTQSRTRGSFDEIVIQSRIEAQEVLDRMFDILSQYGVVKVSELYELTGIQSTHTDHTWGWHELRGAKVRTVPGRTGGGYLLDLPEPEAL